MVRRLSYTAFEWFVRLSLSLFQAYGYPDFDGLRISHYYDCFVSPGSIVVFDRVFGVITARRQQSYLS